MTVAPRDPPPGSLDGGVIFSEDEVERYARHLVLSEVGGPGQQALKRARVPVSYTHLTLPTKA